MGVKYMQWWEELAEAKDEGHKAGREEGHKAGELHMLVSQVVKKLRKGKATGKVRSLTMKDGETKTISFEQPDPAYPNCQLLIFCGQGSAQVKENGESIVLAQGESVYEVQAADANLVLSARGDCSFMIAQMQF